MSTTLPLLQSIDAHLLQPGIFAYSRGLRRFVHEFLYFGIKEARACMFVGLFFVAMFTVARSGLFGIPRYDVLLLTALGIQTFMLWVKL